MRAPQSTGRCCVLLPHPESGGPDSGFPGLASTETARHNFAQCFTTTFISAIVFDFDVRMTTQIMAEAQESGLEVQNLGV
jgi:hypothetical protein